MRALPLSMLMLTSLASVRAAEPPRLAVFDFEMLDAHTGSLVAVANADMRGNIDESGARATRYLIRERLLAPNFGAPVRADKSGSGLEPRDVPAQMIGHEGGDEIIAVVVTALAAQGEGDASLLASCLQ